MKMITWADGSVADCLVSLVRFAVPAIYYNTQTYYSLWSVSSEIPAIVLWGQHLIWLGFLFNGEVLCCCFTSCVTLVDPVNELSRQLGWAYGMLVG